MEVTNKPAAGSRKWWALGAVSLCILAVSLPASALAEAIGAKLTVTLGFALLAAGRGVVHADPSATLFRAGETLRLVVAGRWLCPLNPLTGQFPAAYQKGPAGRCTLHWGPEQQARLLAPVIP